MKYGYQKEKLSLARSNLMLPHPRGVERSIAGAFQECRSAFADLDEGGLDEAARGWVATIQVLMDITDIVDERGEGKWVVKARSLVEEEQRALSRAVDNLAAWFTVAYWEDVVAEEARRKAPP